MFLRFLQSLPVKAGCTSFFYLILHKSQIKSRKTSKSKENLKNIFFEIEIVIKQACLPKDKQWLTIKDWIKKKKKNKKIQQNGGEGAPVMVNLSVTNSYFIRLPKEVESGGEEVFILLDLLIPPLPLSPLQGASLWLQMTGRTQREKAC